MKTYTYRGYKFYATSTLQANTMRPLYRIEGLKDEGTRPFLTTIEGCKEYIVMNLELGKIERPAPAKRRITKPEQLTKAELAELIEDHHLYTGEYDSKRYYKYSSSAEIKRLMQMSKAQLLDMFNSTYEFIIDEDEERGFCARQLTRSEIAW